jgi:hypothetical protein
MNIPHSLGLFVFIAVVGMLMREGRANEYIQGLVATRVEEGVLVDDPEATFWEKIPAQAIGLQGQEVARPTNPNPAVTAMLVRAAHNGVLLSFLLEWSDKEKDDRIAVDQFDDQVAVELPVRFDPKNPPSPMMGDADHMVTIMQWRASFQRDIDKGLPQVKDFYPNAIVDLYLDQLLSPPYALPYRGALAVDSRMAHAGASPILDQMAKGFGSLTVKPNQSASGKGVWSMNKWRVVISRPMKANSEIDPDLSPGAKTIVAFAVWEGAAKEVGPRKAWANWISLVLAQ